MAKNILFQKIYKISPPLEKIHSALTVHYHIFQLNAVWKSPSIARYASMTMRKNSQYTKFFSKVIYEIMNAGLWNYILSKDSLTTTSCMSSSDLKIKPLGFEKFAFIFVILVSGILSSLVIILVEFKIPKHIYSKMLHQDTEEEHQEKIKERILILLKDSPKIQRVNILKKILSDA